MANVIENELVEVAFFHLPKGLMSEQLRDMLRIMAEEWHSPVISARVISDRKNPNFNYGFATLSRRMAIDMVYFRRLDIHGCHVKVKISTGQRSESSIRMEKLIQQGVMDSRGRRLNRKRKSQDKDLQ